MKTSRLFKYVALTAGFLLTIFATVEFANANPITPQRFNQDYMKYGPMNNNYCILNDEYPTICPRYELNLDQRYRLHCFDDETRAQIIEILEEVQKGTLTTEEARAKLNELGIQFPQNNTIVQAKPRLDCFNNQGITPNCRFLDGLQKGSNPNNQAQLNKNENTPRNGKGMRQGNFVNGNGEKNRPYHCRMANTN